MSIASEIERISLSKGLINDKLQELGVSRGDTINDIANNMSVLVKPTGNAGQYLAFTSDNVIGAVDAPSVGGGVQLAYIVGSTPFAADWLSKTDGGDALTPTTNMLYQVNSPGDHLRKFYMWNGEDYVISAQKVNAFVGNSDIVVVPETTQEFEPQSNATFIDVVFDKGTVLAVLNITHVANTGAGRTDVYYRINDNSEIQIVNLHGVSYGNSGGFEDVRLSIPVKAGDRLRARCSRPNTFIGVGVHTIKFSVYAAKKFETDEYLPSTDTEDGKSGLVPSISKNSTAEALTPKGWGEVDFDVTKEEIKDAFVQSYGSVTPKGQIYSLEEAVIGQWVDKKPLYRKVVNCGALPNNTSKMVNPNIANLESVIFLSGMCLGLLNNSMSTKPIPFAHHAAANGNILLDFLDGQIRIVTGSDYSSLNCYVIVEYTKTTDPTS